MKKIKYLGIIALFTSLNAYAVLPGGYIGAEFGTAQIKATDGKTSGNNFMGGLILGSNCTCYTGFETHLDYYSSPTVQGPCGSSTVRLYGLDLLFKGMFPFGNSGLSVVGKGGAAVLRTSAFCNINAKTAVRPMVSVGASYDISQTTVIELMASRIFVNNNVFNQINQITLGITYHFVEKYCGQFLC